MNSASQVDQKIVAWKTKGLSNAEMAVKIAEACMGWPYIYGDRGQLCTPAHRRAKASGTEGDVIVKKCQVASGKKSSCSGCKWYPAAGKTRAFDCRGFTYWVLLQLGIKIMGAGATSQWNNKANWTAKGKISEMPADQVCCVFMADGSKMKHTGLHIGGGVIIHCSGEVKRGKTTDRGWTHYAVPVGIEDSPGPAGKPTLRRGDSGPYVTLLQTKLIQLGYAMPKYGADGKFGSETETALKVFQKDVGLPVTGICNEDTWNALDGGKTALYTVTVQHVSKSVAEGIIKTYGGTMTAEG